LELVKSVKSAKSAERGSEKAAEREARKVAKRRVARSRSAFWKKIWAKTTNFEKNRRRSLDFAIKILYNS